MPLLQKGTRRGPGGTEGPQRVVRERAVQAGQLLVSPPELSGFQQRILMWALPRIGMGPPTEYDAKEGRDNISLALPLKGGA